MKDRASALRYARALEAALDTEAEMASAAEALTAASQIVSADPAVAAALSSPGVDLDRRRALLAALASKLGMPDKALRLLGIMMENGHFHLLEPMAEHFARLSDARRGILQAQITTAAPLSPELAEKARQALTRSTGRDVRLDLRTDPSLIGGMVAKVGSTIYDGSVKARLDALRNHLTRS